MEDIDFGNLLSNFMEIEYDSDNDDYFQIDEEEEEECLKLEDDVSEEDILDLKAIASGNFDPVVFDRYERIIPKCKEKISNLLSESLDYVWKYCKKYLSGNIPLLIYIFFFFFFFLNV